MSKDMAMKTLGLTGLQGQSKGKPKGVNDYSEEEINKAFQSECRNLSKFKWDHYNVKLNLLPKIVVLSFRFSTSPKKCFRCNWLRNNLFQLWQGSHHNSRIVMKLIKFCWELSEPKIISWEKQRRKERSKKKSWDKSNMLPKFGGVTLLFLTMETIKYLENCLMK